jgi:hypothetical protein
MSRAVLRVLMWGRRPVPESRQRAARARSKAVILSKSALSAPGDRIHVLVGQWQSTGALRPLDLGSMPIRSYRPPVFPIRVRMSGGRSSEPPPGPPPLSSITPIRRSVSLAPSRESATSMVRPEGWE